MWAQTGTRSIRCPDYFYRAFLTPGLLDGHRRGAASRARTLLIRKAKLRPGAGRLWPQRGGEMSRLVGNFVAHQRARLVSLSSAVSDKFLAEKHLKFDGCQKPRVFLGHASARGEAAAPGTARRRHPMCHCGGATTQIATSGLLAVLASMPHVMPRSPTNVG